MIMIIPMIIILNTLQYLLWKRYQLNRIHLKKFVWNTHHIMFSPYMNNI